MLRSTCALLLIFAFAADADVQTGAVHSGDQAIPGATITAECGNEPKITTTTDASGRFELGGLPSTSCKYTVLMFGFVPQQKNAAATSTPLTFDLTLQTHATAPVAPKPAAPAVTSAPTPAPSATTPAAPGQPPANTPGVPRPSLAQAQAAQNGRGGRGARGSSQQAQNGRGANNNQVQTSGFQSLNLVEDADAPPASDAPASVLGAGEATAPASGDAFTVNGTLSQGVEAQPGDGFGPGGPGGFGIGPGGPGGQFGERGGPGGDGGGRGGGPAGGPGGRGGGGFAGGGGGRGGGGFGGGGRGGGGFGGPGGRGGRGRGPNGVTAFGNRAGRGRGPQWQLSVSYLTANSALNARPYSLSAPTVNGLPPAKPATATNELRLTLGGPIMIPKTPINLKNSHWNLNVTGHRDRQGVENIGSVPIAPFRTGDFSSLLAAPIPTVIYDPLNNQPFANNIIPQSRISQAALGLLKFYPLPTAIGLTKNYEFDASNPNDNNTVNGQVIIPFTAKDRLNVNLSAQSRDSARIQTFGYRDPTSGGGKALTLSYSRTLQPTMVNTFSISVNRNTTNNLSYFSNGENVAGDLGIAGVLATPLTYGPPTLSFQGASGLASLSDSAPSTNHSFTYTLTERVVKNIGKHTVQAGVTGSKRQSNSLVANNARGNFAFSGASTEQIVDGSPVTSLKNPTGYDVADFLLGLPAQTSVTNYLNGNDMFYYRQNTIGAYVNDDFRASAKLTINGGLRWDINLPQTEKYDHMANIEFSPDGMAAQRVTPGQPYAYGGGDAPTGLIQPFYRMIEPQIGIAAKPWSKRPIVFRGGYGIRYDGGSLAALGSRLVTQAPFVQSVTLTPAQALGKTGQVLTLENGFPALSDTLTNSFAVSPNFRPAMSQQWNAMAQYTLGRSYVVQATYSGNKGSYLPVIEGPDRATPGDAASLNSRIPIQNLLSTINLEESIGHSTFNSGQLQVTRRLARGVGTAVTYTLQKGMSDSSTFGSSIVQIEGNLAAERAVMANYPHQDLAIRFNYQTFAGNQKSQFIYKVIRGWQLFGSYDVNSGNPFTATVGGDPSGTGLTGSTRANATGLPVEDGSGYFNTNAFALVLPGTFGTAGRNTIPGIVNFSINASAMRTFRFGERHRLQFTFNTSNPLNHVSINGIGTQVGNYNYGLATSAMPMRTVTAQARFTY